MKAADDVLILLYRRDQTNNESVSECRGVQRILYQYLRGGVFGKIST